MLQALGAGVRLVSASGERELKVADLYENDGMQYLHAPPRRDPDRDRAARAGRVAQHLLEAPSPRLF
jgi:hypothetical protein